MSEVIAAAVSTGVARLKNEREFHLGMIRQCTDEIAESRKNLRDSEIRVAELNKQIAECEKFIESKTAVEQISEAPLEPPFADTEEGRKDARAYLEQVGAINLDWNTVSRANGIWLDAQWRGRVDAARNGLS